MKQSTQPTSLARHGWAGTLKLLQAGLLALLLVWSGSASAQTVTTTTNFTVGATVPDGSPSGVASAQTISTPVVYVTDVNVTLKLSGTFNGDLYCYLTHG